VNGGSILPNNYHAYTEATMHLDNSESQVHEEHEPKPYQNPLYGGV